MYALVDERLYPDLNPIAWHPAVHALDPKLWQHYLNLVIWDVLICVVMTHKTVRALPDFRAQNAGKAGTVSQDHRVELRREVYQYKSRACRVLNHELQNPETQLSDLTLICVLTMLLAEVGPFFLSFFLSFLVPAEREIHIYIYIEGHSLTYLNRHKSPPAATGGRTFKAATRSFSCAAASPRSSSRTRPSGATRNTSCCWTS